MKKRKKRNPQVDVENYGRAFDLLSENFSNSFMDTYSNGKTLFRDFLYERMGCSFLEAEELVDALERNGKIKFTQIPRRKRFGMWEILSASV